MSTELQSQRMLVSLLGQTVEVARHQHPAALDTILLLHEALGSVAYWKDFPERLARATGANVLLYSRAGQGSSEGPIAPRNRDSYLREVNEVIPALLQHFSVNFPVLYGHSEGGGLGIIYAATSQRVKMLILESPFVVAQESSREHIRGMASAYSGSHLQQRLAQYHRDPDNVFSSWVAGVGEFGDGESPFGDFIARISCPVLVLQGANDEFGTKRHLDAILAALPHAQHTTFADTQHLPHRQQTDAVIERVSRFLAGGSNGFMAKTQTLIAQAYSAFNHRDIDSALALMSENVSWPKASEGGRVVGKEEIRAYWLRQWQEFDPHVDPLEVIDQEDGTTGVRVHLVVKSLGGDVLSDSEVWHVYTIANGLIERMDLKENEESSDTTPSTAFSRH